MPLPTRWPHAARMGRQRRTGIDKTAPHRHLAMSRARTTGGSTRARTVVLYFSDLDKPRAEALADIVRAEGLPGVATEMSGSGQGTPSALYFMFGTDAE